MSAVPEPQVLAHAKRRLFTDEGSYAVADTQFSTDTWLANETIDEAVIDALAPFNHVQVGSGYPDLVGVGTVDEDLLAVERLGDDPPLIVVEAKGHDQSGTVDVERGIVQAHDRLGEANAAYVAVPISAIDGTDRTLCRELNVGLLGVTADGAVEPVERPRVIGNRTTTETSAIRFQASAQGVTDQSFGLNQPKNYLAYPLALAHDRPTEAILADRVVGAVDAARAGAAFLGIVEETVDGVRHTPLGDEVVRFALREHGTVDEALSAFDDWKRSRKRFCTVAPRWGQLARRVVYQYPATTLLVEELQHLHEDGVSEPTLPELVEYLHELHPSFTIELFVRGDQAVRRRVLTPDGELRRDPLADGAIYHSPTVFQLKAMLFHAGILTTRGTEPSNLDPTTDQWALCEPVDRR